MSVSDSYPDDLDMEAEQQQQQNQRPRQSQQKLHSRNLQLAGFDPEQTLLQAIVNEGQHLPLLQSRAAFTFDEKELRDLAAAEVAQHVASSEAKNDKRRKQLSAEEKAKQNRDRNREHAKNTRLRKKAYVTKLKGFVDKLSEQREEEEEERVSIATTVFTTHNIRKSVVRTMLAYRVSNERAREKWAALLDEGVTFTLPVTPYRSFPRGDIMNNSRVLVGIDAMIADAASLCVMAESIGQGAEQWKELRSQGHKVRMSYFVQPEEMLVAGDGLMCRYTLRTDNAVACGALMECVQYGMLQCKFNKQHKLVSAEMIFDVMGFMQQLQRASKLTPEGAVVPNTLELAMQPSEDARVITQAEYPFTITHVNKAWCRLLGYSYEQVLGQSMRILQGEETDMDAMTQMMYEVQMGRAASITITNYTRTGRKFTNYLRIYPLSSIGDLVSHFVGVLEELPNSQTLKRKFGCTEISRPHYFQTTDSRDPLFLETVEASEDNSVSETKIGDDAAEGVNDDARCVPTLVLPVSSNQYPTNSSNQLPSSSQSMDSSTMPVNVLSTQTVPNPQVVTVLPSPQQPVHTFPAQHATIPRGIPQSYPQTNAEMSVGQHGFGMGPSPSSCPSHSPHAMTDSQRGAFGRESMQMQQTPIQPQPQGWQHQHQQTLQPQGFRGQSQSLQNLLQALQRSHPQAETGTGQVPLQPQMLMHNTQSHSVNRGPHMPHAGMNLHPQHVQAMAGGMGLVSVPCMPIPVNFQYQQNAIGTGQTSPDSQQMAHPHPAFSPMSHGQGHGHTLIHNAFAQQQPPNMPGSYNSQVMYFNAPSQGPA